MENKAYFDLENINARRPSCFRRVLFLTSLVFLGGFFYRHFYPIDFEIKVDFVKEKAYVALPYIQQLIGLVTVNGKLKTPATPITLVSE